MNKKLQILQQRHERLVSEIGKQRVQFAQAIEVWRAPLALADQCFAAISFIKKHPIFMAASTAILVNLLRKSFVGKWFSRGFFVLQLARKVHSKFFA